MTDIQSCRGTSPFGISSSPFYPTFFLPLLAHFQKPTMTSVPSMVLRELQLESSVGTVVEPAQIHNRS